MTNKENKAKEQNQHKPREAKDAAPIRKNKQEEQTAETVEGKKRRSKQTEKQLRKKAGTQTTSTPLIPPPAGWLVILV